MGARGVHIHGETPLRLDNIDKNAGCPLFILFSYLPYKVPVNYTQTKHPKTSNKYQPKIAKK